MDWECSGRLHPKPLREAFLNEIPALGPFNCWNLINAFGWLRLRFLACSNCLTQRRRDAKENSLEDHIYPYKKIAEALRLRLRTF